MTAYRFCRATRMHVDYAVARCLQSVQNAAARLVAGTRRRYDHNHPQFFVSCICTTSPSANSFQDCRLGFRALTGQAPAYFADDCRLISDSERCRLRSSSIRTCVTLPLTYTRFGDRSFFSGWSSSLERSTVCTPGSGLDV